MNTVVDASTVRGGMMHRRPIVLLAVAIFAFCELDICAAQDTSFELQAPAFDTTFCGMSECGVLLVRNLSQHILTLTVAAQPRAPFSGIVPHPIVAGPGEELHFQICYQPVQSSGIDSQRIEFKVTSGVAGRGAEVSASVLLVGKPVAPVAKADPPAKDLGRVRVGEDDCSFIVVENAGSAPLVITSISSAHLSSAVSVPDPIPPGGTAPIDFCIYSTELGAHSDTLRVRYLGCTEVELQVPVALTGWDSLNIATPGEIRGRPGSIIHVPVRLYGRVPAHYGVTSFSFELRYNKTMLYALGSAPLSQGTLIKGMRILSSEIERRFIGHEGQAIVRLTGELPLQNQAQDSVLLVLPFLVLHGDSRETPIRIIDASMNDGVPSLGALFEGRFIADSLDFHDRRLIDSSPRYLGLLEGSFPNPTRGQAFILFRMFSTAEVRLCIYNAAGTLIRTVVDGRLEEGVYQADIDLGGCSEGVYFMSFEAGGQTQGGRILYFR